ncbi:MAG: type II secretion system F family protein [Candidatus Shapirobacteria bacterium]|nr:type II secretion system F family protein [Candidatus Shapirobacteria bacterium]
MDKFKYKAKDKDSKTVEGLVEAADINQAAKILRERNLLVITVNKKNEDLFVQVKKGFDRIGIQDKVNFTRQLSTMVNAGLTITESLSILELQTSPAMSNLITDVLHQVESGISLTDALQKHSNIFDQIYIALIKAGETAGVLDKILLRLADNLEKQNEFRQKIKGAMIYPIVVIGGMIGVVAVMIIFVIPKLTAIYEEFQADLPISTKILIGISKFATHYWFLALGVLAALFFLFRYLSHNYYFRRQFDQFSFKIPIIGKLRKAMILTEFTRTLGLLVGSGILIVDAIEVTTKSLNSPNYEEKMKEVSKEVEKGLPLAMSLAKTEIFPPILPQMVAVGEETGKLDEVLVKVSTYFEQQADAMVKGLTAALEPLIMVVLGVGVGFLMMAIIMPIYNLTNQF